MREVNALDVARVGECRPKVVGVWCLAPVEPHVDEVGAEGLHHPGPPLAEVSGGEDELAIARGREVCNS